MKGGEKKQQQNREKNLHKYIIICTRSWDERVHERVM